MFIGFGDMAQSHQLRRLTAEAKTNVTQLSTEVATSTTANTTMHLKGNMRPLASIEATLSRLDSYQTRAKEAVLQAEMMQSSLETIERGIDGVFEVLTSTANFPTDLNLEVSANEAREALRSIFQALNTSGPNGALFGGTATDQSPLASFDTFMQEIDTLLIAAADVSDVVASVETYFDDPSGFAASIFQGSDAFLTEMNVGPSTKIELRAKADQPEVKAILKGLALAYAAQATPGAMSQDDRGKIAQKGFDDLVQSQAGLNQIRAGIGRAQEALDSTVAANEAQSISYQMARQSLIGVDPYEAATALEEQQTQLETIYAITARLSRLNLTDFL